MSTLAPAVAPERVARPPRIATLDALRGFALCGIIFANAPSILRLDPLMSDGQIHPVAIWVDQLVQGRFFPLFSLLFGIGFGLIWAGAGGRTSTPRLVLLRRLLALGCSVPRSRCCSPAKRPSCACGT
ncbi:hypothetical protein ACQCX2_10890 [Propionibacteriaceae bacterium Y1700]|uniref:hypothetical protein n=1 Tax=Microlunatus sp. Y1700 TaxID=3418487 RepID=UPI003DA71CCC